MRLYILHAGDLQGLSPGGIAEFVREYSHQTGEIPKTVVGIASRDPHRKPNTDICVIGTARSNRWVSAQYSWYLMRWIMRQRTYVDDIFFIQRPEYILPFLFRRQLRVVMAVHGSGANAARRYTGLSKLIHLALAQVAVRRAEKIMIFGRRAKDTELYARFADKMVTVRIGIPRDFSSVASKETVRQQLGIPSDDFVVAYSGRLSNEEKRVLLLPLIAKSLHQRGVSASFVVIGDGPDWDRLEGMIRAEGLTEHFRMVGMVTDRSRVASLISAADVGIILSRWEGICLSALEFLKVGVPVVATSVGDIPEYLDSRRGILIDPFLDSNRLVCDFSDAIVRIMALPTPVPFPASYEALACIQEVDKHLKHLVQRSR